jgi:hypothetical protein
MIPGRLIPRTIYLSQQSSLVSISHILSNMFVQTVGR